MYNIIVVGMTGQGKSHFTKEFIRERNCHVFDVQNEYHDLSLNPASNRSRHTAMNEMQFINECARRRQTVCVFEEATGFLEGKTSKELRRLVLSKRHTENVMIFCFHSLSSIPPRLMQLCNYVKLFKTVDEPYQVESKFPSLYPYYLQLRDMPHQSSLNIQMIPQ